jgi:phosphoglycolate phosphatase-like HAD superfamily hydrolase
MGDRLEQVKKMAEVGITNFDFEVYDFKDETIFRNLMHRYPAKQYVMIGDSLSRDIIPAKNSGIEHTIRVLYSTNSYWGEKKDPANNGMHEVYDLEQAYDILKEISKEKEHDDSREEAVRHSY